MRCGPAARVVACAVASAVVWGCASSVTLTTAPLAKRVPPDLRTVRAQPQDFSGAPCLREEVVRYLDTPGGIVLAGPQETYDLQLTGGVSRLEVHSNRGDKEVALLYFTAFVVTAPIAAIMYGAKDWQADAAADGELLAKDRTGAVVWTRAVTVSVAENQRTMPSAEALKAAMTQAACQKLAATLLNGLAEHLGLPGAR